MLRHLLIWLRLATQRMFFWGECWAEYPILERRSFPYFADSFFCWHLPHSISLARSAVPSDRFVRIQETPPHMPTCFQQLRSLDELREYILETLCYQYQLRIDAFQMTQRLLRRGDKPCGLLFCLHGPRASTFTAISDSDRTRILC